MTSQPYITHPAYGVWKTQQPNYYDFKSPTKLSRIDRMYDYYRMSAGYKLKRRLNKILYKIRRK